MALALNHLPFATAQSVSTELVASSVDGGGGEMSGGSLTKRPGEKVSSRLIVPINVFSYTAPEVQIYKTDNLIAKQPIMGGSVQPTEGHHALEDNHIGVTCNVGGNDMGDVRLLQASS